MMTVQVQEQVERKSKLKTAAGNFEVNINNFVVSGLEKMS